MPGRGFLEVDYMHTHMACLDNCVTSVIHNQMSEDHKAKWDNVPDYAVSYNVGFCWALRLSQVLAFTECPIDSQAEESLKKFMHQ